MAITTWTSSVYENNAWESVKRDVVVSHEGLVLRTYAKDVRVMSDVWDMARCAEVWNPTKGCVEEVELCIVGCSVHATRDGNAVVDATPEVLAAVKAWTDAKENAAREADRRAMRARVGHGSIVKVVKGNEKGKSGRLFWIGEAKRFGSKVSVRVGIALDNQKDARGYAKNVCWTYMDNLAVVGAESDAALKAAEVAFAAL